MVFLQQGADPEHNDADHRDDRGADHEQAYLEVAESFMTPH
jgi:hypothetical protein